MSCEILVLPGDGIGPEITPATLQVLQAADKALSLDLTFETHDIGLKSLAEHGVTLRDDTLARIPEVDGVILGPVSHYDYPPRAEGGINPSAELRTEFELFANIRPCRSREGLTVLREPMDLVIVRENTEGFYADRNMFAGTGEFMPDATAPCRSARSRAQASARVARAAFELAQGRRQKVTAVHKANVAQALRRAVPARGAQGRRASIPDIELEELIVDATAALLIRQPARFDVHRHHQHVRRHPLRRSLRADRQPGSGRCDQRGR